MRKILNNYHKSKRLNGTTKGKIGTILGIQDKNGEHLVVGNKVRFRNYVGTILYEPNTDEYMVCLDGSMWHGDNEYDVRSYGKAVGIPMDNGARMELEKVG